MPESALPLLLLQLIQVIGYFAAGGTYPGVPEEGGPLLPDTQMPFSNRIARFQDAFWRFLRPHTIRGTIIGTTAVVVRALIDNSHLIDWGLLPKALRGLLALLCGNGYIVGINQIYDIGIDKCVVHPSHNSILL
ncbi:hypothetical protein L7F22_035017 [Adiantum nelumboides]|nr:hypothetical protein [Adiantum nelumboides]